MKKLLLFVFIVGASLSMSAQNIEIWNSSGNENLTNDTMIFWHAVSPNVVEDDFKHDNFAKIVNKSGGSMTIKLRRIEHQTISGTADYLCWGATCFGAYNAGDSVDWYVDDQAVVASGDTAGGTGLVVYLIANDQVGEALYQYHFYNNENPSDSASVYVRWSISLFTEIEDIANAVQKMQVYPNPAADNFTVDLNAGIKADNQEVIIRDMLGKVIRRENIPSAQEKFYFSTSEMQGGIYFVSYAIDGEILKTNKLVVK